MITIIDYGAGNLKSVTNAFKAISYTPLITQDPDNVKKATAVILPGVGAFGDGISRLKELELLEAVQDAVIRHGIPYLGICLGLQFIADFSREMGEHRGLGWIKGAVEKINPSGNGFRIPHIGWNNIEIIWEDPLFTGLAEEPVFYFVHSYHFNIDEADKEYITSKVYHGMSITASLQKDNIFAVQFHPEKSQQNGMTVLKNFVKML